MANIETIKLEIPSSTRYIIIARKAAEEIAARAALTTEQMEDVKLAVGEACTNAVKFSKTDNDKVRITYRVKPDMLEIEVENAGKEFLCDGKIPQRPDPCKLNEGGLGLYIINEIMDNLDICHKSGKTTVTMTKRLTL